MRSILCDAHVTQALTRDPPQGRDGAARGQRRAHPPPCPPCSGRRTATSYASPRRPLHLACSLTVVILLRLFPQQRQAHEQPVIFYSVVIGLIGPAMVITVPPVRKSLGWRPSEPIPTSYPGELRLSLLLCVARMEEGRARGGPGARADWTFVPCRSSEPGEEASVGIRRRVEGIWHGRDTERAFRGAFGLPRV